jgi:hypothetical protein
LPFALERSDVAEVSVRRYWDLPRSVWALLAVVLLALGMAPSCGFYSRLAIGAAVGALVCALLASLRSKERADYGLFLSFLVSAALLLSGAGAFQCHLRYAENPAWYGVIWVAAAMGSLLLLSFAPSVWQGSRTVPWLRTRLAALFLTGAVLRAGVLFTSPAPVVDVFVWLRDAPDFLLQRHNPYAVDYESPYETERAAHYGVADPAEARPAAYPPLPILLCLPFRLAGGDIRWVNVIGDLLAAWCLFLIAQRGGSLLAGSMLAGIYLFLPRAPFLIEQAWYEPLLAALLGGGFYLADQGRSRLGCLLLALGVTAKQYGPMMLPALCRGWRNQLPALLLALAGVGAALFLPFFLWGPDDFLSILLFKHLARPTQFESLTLLSAVHDLVGWQAPRWVILAPGLLLIGWIAWRTPRQGTIAALGMGTSLLVFCLCHTQGYFNYFYLCQYLWLLGIAGTLRPEAPFAGAAGFHSAEPLKPDAPRRVLPN